MLALCSLNSHAFLFFSSRQKQPNVFNACWDLGFRREENEQPIWEGKVSEQEFLRGKDNLLWNSGRGEEALSSQLS